jgi:hypothetical protein
MNKLKITNDKKEMERWVLKDKNNIVLLGIIPKSGILYSKEYLINCNILECVYTSIKNHLSFKKTVKNNKYHLLDNLSDKKIGLINEKDTIEIINDKKQFFIFEKNEMISGVLRTYVENSDIITEKKDKYFASKYKNAFYLKKDVLSSKYNFMSSIVYNTLYGVVSDERILKYSQDLYKKVNAYLNGKRNTDEDVIIEKTINAMDEMFMVAPVSEDNMILYRGYDFTGNTSFNPMDGWDKKDITELIRFGVQKGYLSTTTNKNLGFYYTMINNTSYLNLLVELSAMAAATVAVGLSATIAYFIYKNAQLTKNNRCCFTILHLDDGIPFIKLNSLVCADAEVLLPRGLEMEYLRTENDYELVLQSAKNTPKRSLLISAHHVRLSLTEELKKKYKKGEKCVKYDVWKLSNLESSVLFLL